MAAATAALVAMAGLSLYQGASQADSLKADSIYKQGQLQQNEMLANFQADEALRAGGVAAGNVEKKTRQIRGAQRVAAAANSVDINSGSAATLQAETAMMGAMDIVTVQNNAWREAWGLKNQATQYGQQAGMVGRSGAIQSQNSLLTGGLNAASYLSQIKSTGKGASTYSRQPSYLNG